MGKVSWHFTLKPTVTHKSLKPNENQRPDVSIYSIFSLRKFPRTETKRRQAWERLTWWSNRCAYKSGWCVVTKQFSSAIPCTFVVFAQQHLEILSTQFKIGIAQKGISLDKSQMSLFRAISYSTKDFIAISLKPLSWTQIRHQWSRTINPVLMQETWILFQLKSWKFFC